MRSPTAPWSGTAPTTTPSAPTALPSALKGRFDEEPRHLDLRWARDEDHLDLRHSRFREAVADLAAPLHGVPKDGLEGEDIRQHRQGGRLARGAVVGLAVLLVASLVCSTSSPAIQTRPFDTGQRGPVDVDFSSDGTTLVTTSQDTTVRLWDAKSGRARSPVFREHAELSVARAPLAVRATGVFMQVEAHGSPSHTMSRSPA